MNTNKPITPISSAVFFGLLLLSCLSIAISAYQGYWESAVVFSITTATYARFHFLYRKKLAIKAAAEETKRKTLSQADI